jgi:SAM-dependent methyltransferase
MVPYDDAVAATPSATTLPDYAAVKARQQATWASGDFAVIGTTLQIVGESLAEAVDLRAGERVIDVAAGNGNATLAAARRFARVTSTDYVPALLDRGRERAAAERLDVTFRVADAEALPFDDASFDVALSTFGAMFAPRHALAASELARVVRPGGRIGLAAWTPEGFLGAMFRTMAAHVPPVAGIESPMLWGTESHLARLFGRRAARIDATRRTFMFRYRSAAHFVDVFRRYYGPTHRAFEALGAAGRAALAIDLTALLARWTLRSDALLVPGEYLETVVTLA